MGLDTKHKEKNQSTLAGKTVNKQKTVKIKQR